MNALNEMIRLWEYSKEVSFCYLSYYKLRIWVTSFLGIYIENLLIPSISPIITYYSIQ